MNPDTGRATKVAADSDEAISWPTVAEYRASQRKRKALGKKVGGAFEKVAAPKVEKAAAVVIAKATGAKAAVARGAAKVAATLGGSVGSGVATLGVAGTAAAVAAAAALGYAIGTAGLKLWQYLKPEERDARKSIAIAQARRNWEESHGRPMTAEEHKAFYRGFTDSLSVKRS